MSILKYISNLWQLFHQCLDLILFFHILYLLSTLTYQYTCGLKLIVIGIIKFIRIYDENKNLFYREKTLSVSIWVTHLACKWQVSWVLVLTLSLCVYYPFWIYRKLMHKNSLQGGRGTIRWKEINKQIAFPTALKCLFPPRRPVVWRPTLFLNPETGNTNVFLHIRMARLAGKQIELWTFFLKRHWLPSPPPFLSLTPFQPRPLHAEQAPKTTNKWKETHRSLWVVIFTYLWIMRASHVS